VPPRRRSSFWAQYWADTRAPRYSLLFALPLLIAYQGLATVLSRGATGGMRNGADVLLQDAFYAVFGRYEPIAFAVAVIGPAMWLVARDLRAGGRLVPGVFVGMLAESCLLAAAFGTVIGTITAHLLHFRMMIGPLAHTPLATRIMLALGAGIYEELLFRVILVSGIAAIAERLLKWHRRPASIVAVVISATIFSAFHYIGPYGDPFRIDSFLFRLLGGVAFSVVYLLRGFGITAWTHALYDVLVLTA
jgi:Type II CAAX prenyl endopeptidase Rce1-like